MSWIRWYVRHHGLRHPGQMGEGEVLAYLAHLAEDGKVSHSTQMQALSALLFLYRDVLVRPLGDLRGLVRARGPRRVPVVLSPLTLVFATIPNDKKGLLSFFRRIGAKPGEVATPLSPEDFARIAAEHDLILRPPDTEQ